mmetsp:Transcript_28824/g.67618  ORF Transcript_28824/g.67618 Transcript_28824/m.67618 type:complete len:237 (+) Transcript_28824:1236-1946(+)
MGQLLQRVQRGRCVNELHALWQRVLESRDARKLRLLLPLIVHPRLPNARGEVRRRHAVEQLYPPLLLTEAPLGLRIPRVVAIPCEPAVIAVHLLESRAAVDLLGREAVCAEARAGITVDGWTKQFKEVRWGQLRRVNADALTAWLLHPPGTVPRLPDGLGELRRGHGRVQKLQPAALQPEARLRLRIPRVLAVVRNPPVGPTHRPPARPAIDCVALDAPVETQTLLRVCLGGSDKH